jgi:hypothetical protein
MSPLYSVRHHEAIAAVWRGRTRVGRLGAQLNEPPQQLLTSCLPLADTAGTGFGVKLSMIFFLINHCARAWENQRKPCVTLKITLRRNQSIFS